MAGHGASADEAPAPTIGADGWAVGMRRLESPNFDARPPGVAIDLLVVHAISLPPGRFGTGAVARLFTNRLEPGGDAFLESLRDLRVSAHFLIERDGTAVQLVGCGDRAWHAGRSSWLGRPACNDFSVGIELEGSEFEPFTDAQYRALSGIQRALCARYPIRATRGHSEIAPGRKTDPGPLFDWSRIVRDHAPAGVDAKPSAP